MVEVSSPTWRVFTCDLPDQSAVEALKLKIIQWLEQFEQFSFLDSNGHTQDPYHKFDLLVGAGCLDTLCCQSGQGAFEQLAHFQKQYPQEYIFGYFTYDLKNELEDLQSAHKDRHGFPELQFFVPEHRIELRGNTLTLASATAQAEVLYQQIQGGKPKTATFQQGIELQARISREEYLSTIQKIRAEILQGNLYELNFCQEFFYPAAKINPFDVFRRLNQKTRAPFSAFYRWHEHFALCASPERFLAKRENKLISQPIKGTIRRGKTEEEDLALKNELYLSPKNRAENVMIVDLVRNDLARSCRAGSVTVEELFGIYGFATVYQMISTASGILRKDSSAIEAIQYAFPMGSMTGAPKISSMQLIEKLESSRRGLYSGAIGYFAPNGDFDFNVVIRSLLYNQHSGYLSLQVGGAIVYDSVPAEEYAECLLKAERIFEVLRG